MRGGKLQISCQSSSHLGHQVGDIAIEQKKRAYCAATLYSIRPSSTPKGTGSSPMNPAVAEKYANMEQELPVSGCFSARVNLELDL